MPQGKVIEVIIYGMHPESYDTAAGTKGAYHEFKRGVDLLLEYNIPFVLNRPFFRRIKPNLKSLKPGLQLFRRWIKPGFSMNFELRARRDDPGKNERIKKLRLTPDETVAMLARDPKYVPGMQEFCSKLMRPPGEKLFSCGAGHGTCVDAYGYAQMCLPLRHPDTVFNLHT